MLQSDAISPTPVNQESEMNGEGEMNQEGAMQEILLKTQEPYCGGR